MDSFCVQKRYHLAYFRKNFASCPIFLQENKELTLVDDVRLVRAQGPPRDLFKMGVKGRSVDRLLFLLTIPT